MEFTGQYLIYADYRVLGGLLSESAFNLLEFESRKKVDELTFGRLKELDIQINEVKLCIYKLIELINENKTSIKSESIDGYSLTLMDKEQLESTKESIIEEYLSDSKLEDDTPYLYCGVDCEAHIW